MIRSFEGQEADHVWQQVVEAFRVGDGVLVQPSRAGATKEILHAALTINDPRQRWVASRQPPLNVAFAIAEVVWIMTGRNDLAFVEAWNSKLSDYVGTGPQLHGAYGYRLRSPPGHRPTHPGIPSAERQPEHATGRSADLGRVC